MKQRKQRESSVSLKFAHSLHQLRRDSLCMATLAPTMTEMVELHREDQRSERRKMADDVRLTLLRRMYPLPRHCKHVANAVTAAWTMAMVALGVVHLEREATATASYGCVRSAADESVDTA